jgi:membrane protein YqaA with SNARE-associated domain
MTIHFKPFRFGKAEMGILLLLVALFVLGVGIMTVPFLATLYGRLTTVWTDMAIRWGYAGAFVAALIGSTSATVFFPYTIIVFFLATQGLNPFWLGLLMGLGAGIGQMVGYIIGTMGTTWFQKKKPETYDALERILAYRPRVIVVLLIIFGTSPLPDDMLLIPLGMLRYPWWKVWLPTTLGKIGAGMLVTYSSFFVSRSLDLGTAAGATGIVSQLGTIAALGAIGYIMFKLDWQKIMHRLLDHQAVPHITNSETPL